MVQNRIILDPANNSASFNGKTIHFINSYDNSGVSYQIDNFVFHVNSNITQFHDVNANNTDKSSVNGVNNAALNQQVHKAKKPTQNIFKTYLRQKCVIPPKDSVYCKVKVQSLNFTDDQVLFSQNSQIKCN